MTLEEQAHKALLAIYKVTLPHNATCYYCEGTFRMKPHYIARKKREGKHLFCSLSCTRRYYGKQKKMDNWLASLDFETRITMETYYGRRE